MPDIEDELPRLEYGDAIRKIGNRYATDFIIFRLQDRKQVNSACEGDIAGIADAFEAVFDRAAPDRTGFGIDRLGYIIVHYNLRKIVRSAKEALGLAETPFPPRKDGGYGWFIVEETADSSETKEAFSAGCNIAEGHGGNPDRRDGCVYYYWISKYFDSGIYHNTGTRWLAAKGIPQTFGNGDIPEDVFGEDNAVQLLKASLVTHNGGTYRLNFPCFTEDEFSAFVKAYDMQNETVGSAIGAFLSKAVKCFSGFVPKRLHGQISQWVSVYAETVTGRVVDELMRRGKLSRPDGERPNVNGVFFVEGGCKAV